MGENNGTTGTATMPGLDAVELGSWQNFLDAALRLYATLNRSLVDSHQLTLNDVRLLDILDRSSAGCERMGDLAEELTSLPSRVTRQIHRLEGQHLVTRRPSPDDGRAVLAAITPAGRSRLVDAVRTYGDGVRVNYINRLSRPQVASMGENCRRIVSALEADSSSARLGRV